MNQNELKKALAKLPLGDIHYYDSIGSTNNEALAWATSGAKDWSLVIADEQTAGRGRLDRKWFTPKGTALAFSLILRPNAQEKEYLGRMMGLAALAIVDVLRTLGLVAEIKWPNDVLSNGRKLAGILVESVWSGEEVDYVVIGIGMNIFEGAVPSAELIQFPATSLEAALGPDLERWKILRDILAGMIALRPNVGTDSFITSWEKALAFRGQQVEIEASAEPGRSEGSGQSASGKLVGLEHDGSLRLSDKRGKFVTVRFGDVRLRPQA